MKVAIVTGTREDGEEVRRAVWAALHDFGPDLVIHGACQKKDTAASEVPVLCGADRYAQEWCQETGTPEIPMPAQWQGPSDYQSGKDRNGHMVTIGVCLRACAHVVRGFAFPSPRSRGTYECANRLKREGFPVVWSRVLWGTRKERSA